jgi:DNA-binding Xre family transcriptional regulator
MQICMKMTSHQKQLFLTDLQRVLQQRQWTVSDLARGTGVNQSQVSRIVAGKFKTFSSSVSRICMEIGFELVAYHSGDRAERDRKRISDAAISIWNGTHGDTEVVVSLLQEIARLRGRAPRRKMTRP